MLDSFGCFLYSPWKDLHFHVTIIRVEALIRVKALFRCCPCQGSLLALSLSVLPVGVARGRMSEMFVGIGRGSLLALSVSGLLACIVRVRRPRPKCPYRGPCWRYWCWGSLIPCGTVHIGAYS